MIVDATGDIFALDAEAFVNPVNCVGIMGAGLALQFRMRFRSNFAAYASACQRGNVTLGTILMHDRGRSQQHPRFIANFPTKRHWRDVSRLGDIEDGLATLAEAILFHGIRSIAIPALGCGLGGLTWGDVRPRIVAALAPLDEVRVTLFGPQ